MCSRELSSLLLLLQVCIGILKIYDSLNAKFPAHVIAPKR
jgi:hypothetical protein